MDCCTYLEYSLSAMVFIHLFTCHTAWMHVHLHLKDHICDICEKKFSENSDMNNHKKIVHLEVKDHICDVCKMAFSGKGNLNKHKERFHHGNSMSSPALP